MHLPQSIHVFANMDACCASRLSTKSPPSKQGEFGWASDFGWKSLRNCGFKRNEKRLKNKNMKAYESLAITLHNLSGRKHLTSNIYCTTSLWKQGATNHVGMDVRLLSCAGRSKATSSAANLFFGRQTKNQESCCNILSQCTRYIRTVSANSSMRICCQHEAFEPLSPYDFCPGS